MRVLGFVLCVLAFLAVALALPLGAWQAGAAGAAGVAGVAEAAEAAETAAQSNAMAQRGVSQALQQELTQVKACIKGILTSLEAFDYEPSTLNTEFEAKLAPQIELALRAQNPQLYTESYYNLSLYMLAKAHNERPTAIKALEAEQAQQSYRPLVKWLKDKKAELLRPAKAKQQDCFNLDNEFAELIRLFSN